MGCNCNKTESKDYQPCGCLSDYSASCIRYEPEGTLMCTNINAEGKNLEELIQDIDNYFCTFRTELDLFLTAVNIGNGAKLYSGDNLQGQKQLRTLISSNSSLRILENIEDISFDILNSTETQKGIIEIASEEEVRLGVNTEKALTPSTYQTTLQEAIAGITNESNTVVSGTFSDLVLTLVKEDSTQIVVDFSDISNEIPPSATDVFLNSGVYNSSTQNIDITMSDNSTVNISLVALVSNLTAIANNQTKSDYLETNPSSDAFILNKNPSKTVTLGASGTYNVINSDNNFVIEIDNSVNDVTINLIPITASSEFFVGFVQKGTGTVTFNGFDIKPTGLDPEITGQGHIAAVEVIANTKYLLGGLKEV